MRPVHGFPGHYFNMTPLAIETFLVDDFDPEVATVPDSATPVHTVLDLVERFLGHADTRAREALLAQPLRDVLDVLRADETRTNPLLAAFDEHAMRVLCASFVVIGRKPEAYEAQTLVRMRQGEASVDAWQAVKREYYAARAELIHRHHEVGFYRRLARESDTDGQDAKDAEPVGVLLDAAVRRACSSRKTCGASIDGLRAKERELARSRDRLIQAGMHSSVAERVRKVSGLRARLPRRGS